MKVLITGIGGFAGSHLADHILQTTQSAVFGVLRDGEKSDNIAAHEDKIQPRDSASVSTIPSSSGTIRKP